MIPPTMSIRCPMRLILLHPRIPQTRTTYGLAISNLPIVPCLSTRTISMVTMKAAQKTTSPRSWDVRITSEMLRCSASTASDGSLADTATTRQQISPFHISSIERKHEICYACCVRRHSRLERRASIARNMQLGIIALNASYGTMTATSVSTTVTTVGYVVLEKDLAKITSIVGDAMCASPSQPQPHILA